MKNVLLLVILSVVLVGCGDKIHENIGEDIADDTNQILNIMDGVIEEKNEISEQEKEIFDHYYIKYSAFQKNSELSEEEERLFILVKHIVENPEFYTTLESDKENYEDRKRQINNVIKTGQIYDE
ncbi:hypothetical protein [Virgibacillus salexigens]|uniref:hypothetical protein n=1 Tax=Virgibacillus salexigens TaxID=61016 RepID=UPI00190E1FEA|nr:hypothetical protein [Virgibacillus salexigens]